MDAACEGRNCRQNEQRDQDYYTHQSFSCQEWLTTNTTILGRRPRIVNLLEEGSQNCASPANGRELGRVVAKTAHGPHLLCNPPSRRAGLSLA